MSDELRPVTVLFADIVGSTALGERLAPDEVKALVGECVTLMARSVEEYGGGVQAYLGDGICAYFGVPTAHEDDPERAARTGLRILEVIREYAHDIEAAWGLCNFAVRIGINTGQAAVGVVGASETSTVALGDTTNVAARLQALAKPGTIAVGEATARRLSHRFIFEPLGAQMVKGRDEPVEAWRLVEPRVSEIGSAVAPLTGRTAELVKVREVMGDLIAGRGRILLLTGEPGIGKTRLLAEMRILGGNCVAWLEGHCHSYGGPAAWPFAEMLLNWLGSDVADPPIVIRTKARARLTPLLGSDDHALGQLERLLHLDVRDASEVAAPFLRWVEALASDRPVVVALDGVQWADQATQDLAEHVLELTDRAAVGLVLTQGARTGAAGALRLRALADFSHRATEVPLGPLDDAAADVLVAALLGDADEAVRKRIILEAEGNPLFLVELSRALGERSLKDGRRTRTVSLDESDLLPPALENRLLARIDRLPPDARRLVEAAAAIGRTFPVQVLEAVAGNGSETQALGTLLKSEIVRELGRYPEFECTFTHRLLQEVALTTLTPQRKRELYERVALAYESLYSDSLDEHVERVAHYHAQAGNLARAAEYLERAGAGVGSPEAR